MSRLGRVSLDPLLRKVTMQIIQHFVGVVFCLWRSSLYCVVFSPDIFIFLWFIAVLQQDVAGCRVPN